MSITRGPDGRPWAFADLTADAFPVTMTAYVDGEVIWEIQINPYEPVEIPVASPEQMGRVAMRLRLANGEEYWQEPIPPEEARQYIDKKIEEASSDG